MSEPRLPSNDQDNVRKWASHLTAEDRKASSIAECYVMPDEVAFLCRRISSERGGLHALIGYQGVGKTSALFAIRRELRRPQVKIPNHRPLSSRPVYFFKWDRLDDLLSRLFRQDDPLGRGLKRRYLSNLENTIKEKEALATVTLTATDKGDEETRILRRLITSFNISEVERRLRASRQRIET